MSEAQDSQPPVDPAAVDLVRRRLLKVGGKYVAPAILANLAFGSTAFAQATCMPNQCSPADPMCGPTQNCHPFRTRGGG